jgi:hypothetical protein
VSNKLVVHLAAVRVEPRVRCVTNGAKIVVVVGKSSTGRWELASSDAPSVIHEVASRLNTLGTERAIFQARSTGIASLGAATKTVARGGEPTTVWRLRIRVVLA